MEAAAATQGVKPSPKLAMGQAFIRGRIANRRRMSGSDGSFWMTVIKMPAVDEFSHPSTIEVTSKNPLGEVGDDWNGVVHLEGYPRSYNAKPDPETGEIKQIKTADNRLRVVEQ